MKRVLCPKCDNYITFDETKYTEGQSLVLYAKHCKKQFSIRNRKIQIKSYPQKRRFLTNKPTTKTSEVSWWWKMSLAINKYCL